ncbi:hypothetical protein [Phycicoccus jejuensis]|uniref:hypothetical protein n=1 Tax=Phycicoccus jejuensis TaxID=367299 RepID=UPI0004C3D1B0|nr:hypothetical protein [Phycicoccus jejuensis]
MDDVEWDAANRALIEASERAATLARCLAVAPELDCWRAGEDLGGMLAADALDQARGELERLASGGASSLLDLVERIAEALPVPLE